MGDPRIHWTLDVPLFIALAAAGWAYSARWRYARREAGPRGASVRHAICFVLFCLALLVAAASPLDGLAHDYLFSAHMVQHILYGDVAPLLLLLSLSRVMLRPATKRLLWIERKLGPLAYPGAFLIVWLGLIYLWHVPVLYDAALKHPAVHLLEHFTFFTAGVAIWWPLVQPIPMRHRLKGMWTFAYIAGAKVGLASLGLYLTWSHSALYDYYEKVPRIWDLSPTEDQNVGGAIMMLEQSVLLVLVMVVLFGRMLRQSEEEERRRERLEDAAVA